MQSGMILRALRKAKNLTQSDVASLLKTSRQYYSDYECEKFELPLHHLVFLAELASRFPLTVILAYSLS